MDGWMDDGRGASYEIATLCGSTSSSGYTTCSHVLSFRQVHLACVFSEIAAELMGNVLSLSSFRPALTQDAVQHLYVLVA